MSIFSSYNKYWLFAENVDFSSPIQHLFPSKLWIFLSKPQIVLSKTSELVKRHVSENMNLRFLGHLFLSFRASPWGGGGKFPQMQHQDSVTAAQWDAEIWCDMGVVAWLEEPGQGQPNNSQTAPWWHFQMEVLFSNGKIWLQFWLSIIHRKA